MPLRQRTQIDGCQGNHKCGNQKEMSARVFARIAKIRRNHMTEQTQVVHQANCMDVSCNIGQALHAEPIKPILTVQVEEFSPHFDRPSLSNDSIMRRPQTNFFNAPEERSAGSLGDQRNHWPQRPRQPRKAPMLRTS